MRLFGKGKAAPAEDSGAAQEPARKAGSKGWFREHWLPLSLFIIVLSAFLIRFVYAYGISADDDYALSGGNSASSNLRIVLEIMAGTYDPSNVTALNYPTGSISAYGPAYDYVMAGIASIVTLFGISDHTAAAGTIAWSSPILGALTCMVIYGIGKKMYHEDRVVGVLSALFYAFFGLIIVTSPFSSGTGYAFICFFAALATYFLVCAIKAADAGQYQGPKDVLKDRKVMLYTVAGGLMFGITVLSWTDFWMFMVVAAVIMFIVALVRRVQGKDLWAPVLIADIFLGIGIICGTAWYGAVDQWDAVASGAVVLGLLTVVYATAFAAVQKKPWVITVPVFAVVMIVVGVAIMLLDGDLSHAIFHGNTAYENSLMQDLADNASRTSISEMAGYYGWLTLWFPFILGCYMLYRYRRDGGSMLYGFSLLYIFSMFFVGWFDSGYATVAGPAFAVSCGILSMIVIRGVDMKGYFRSMRGNGIKAGARKALKFFPFCTILVAVFLVIVPNAVYAVDAATPSNDEKAGYYGGLSYDIQTTDSSETSALWSYYSDVDTDGAIVTWMGNSNYAAEAGFSSVTDTYGNGAATMSQIYLADSSAKAVAVMTIRMVLHYDASDFDSLFQNYLTADEAAELESLIDDADAAQSYVKENYSDFPGVSVNSLTDENAIYYAASDYMVDHMTEQQIEELYSSVLSQSGKSGIQYIELDGSMLPLYYNDSSSFSTIAYFGNYTLGDYNAATQFFSYNAYYGYTTYTDAMYETFLWNALIGIDASDYSSSYSLISALATADSSVTVSPLTGISGFQIVYWHLMYNPDDDATNSSSGWVEMDAYEAIAKQRSEGGVINYLSSVMLLEYVGDNSDYSYTSYSGTVTDSSDSTGIEGIEVAVYTYDENLQKYVRGSTSYTDSDGNYTISVDSNSTYYVAFYAGATTSRNGTLFATTTDLTSTGLNQALDGVEVDGTLTISGNSIDVDGTITLVGQASGKEYTGTVAGGIFDISSIIPDTYNATVYTASGSEVGTGTLVVGTSSLIGSDSSTGDGINLELSGGKITVTVTAMDYSDTEGAEVTLTETTSGVTYSGTVGSDGTAVIYVTAGTYSGSVSGSDWIGASTSNTTMSSSGYSRTMSITVYPMVSVSISNGSGSQGIVSAVGYSGYTVDGTTAYLPFTLNEVTYTIYQLSNGSIYYATVTANDTDTTLTADLGTTASTAYTVSGTVKDSDGSGISATVYFIKSDDGAVFAYSSDSDGAYTAYLPSGTYTVYAYGSSQASYSTLEVTADATNDISLETAYSATLAVDYNTNRSSTSTYRYIPFAEVQEAVTIDSTTYSFSVLTSLGTSTSTTGRATVWVPEGASVTATVNGYDTVAFDAAGVVTLYAQWTANSYTVEFDANSDDATGTTASIETTYDTTFTLTQNGFSLTGYTFIGWNTEADGSGTWYADQQSVSNLTTTDGGTVTLYAQWSASAYVVVYVSNGSSTVVDPTSSDTNSITVTSETLSRTGYTFSGWNTEADGSGTDYTSGADLSTLLTTDSPVLTLYAHWTAYSYTVEFDGNSDDVTTTMDTQSMVYGTAATLNTNTFTRDGYVFIGWNTSSSGSGTWYADGQSVINLTSTRGGTVTLYAQWAESSKYVVVYNLNGGTGTSEPSVYESGDIYYIVLGSISRDGYTFNGWNDSTGTAITSTYASMFTMTSSYQKTWDSISSNSSTTLVFKADDSSSQRVSAVSTSSLTVTDEDGTSVTLDTDTTYTLTSSRTSTYTYTLSYDGTTYTVSANEGVSMPLLPGQYTISVDTPSAATMYFTSTTVYIYYDGTIVIDGTVFDAVPVEISYSVGTEITVDSLLAYMSYDSYFSDYSVSDQYATGDEETTDGTTTVWYYFAVYYNNDSLIGVKYTDLFVVTASQGSTSASRVIYPYSIANPTTTTSIDFTTLYDTIEVSGSLGVDIDGSVIVGFTTGTSALDYEKWVAAAVVSPSGGSYSVSLPVVTDSTYTMAIGFAGTYISDDGAVYYYEYATTLVSDITNEDVASADEAGTAITYNPASTSVSTTSDSSSVYMVSDASTDIDVTVTGAVFSGGTGTVSLAFTNNTDTAVSYYLVGEDDFISTSAAYVTVDAYSTSSTVKVSGIYAASVGAWSDGITVSIYTLDGELVDTIPVGEIVLEKLQIAGSTSITGSDDTTSISFATTDTSGSVRIYMSEDNAKPSSYTGASYRYAVTVVNTYLTAQTVNISATAASLGDGWTMLVEVGNVRLSYDSTSGTDVVVPGNATTVIYVTLLNNYGDAVSEDVTPSDVTVTATAGSTTKEKTLSYQASNVGTDSGGVSGGDASDTEEGLSTAFWALLILSTLTLLLIIYSGSKRGMFSRRK